jgi:limonene-1,2-epoxide hydrolase
MTGLPFPFARRGLIGAAAASIALGRPAAGRAAGPEANPALEAQKEKIVSDFCAAWSARDPDTLMPFLDTDIEYHMFEGRPPIMGTEEFSTQLRPFMAGMREITWDILRSCTMGDIVLNERIDHFLRAEGSEAPDNHFHVVGVFLVRGGKIIYWKDYNLSGEI